ncbi:MAG: GNAT family N-acetyltransferase, partial [Sphingorhabdus sp.]
MTCLAEFTEPKILTTRSDLQILVRPATAQDKTALAAMFSRLSPEDLRYRFLSPLKRVGSDVLAMMTNVDHEITEDILAFDASSGQLVANAMLAVDPGKEDAEVALAVDCAYKHKGVSWTLLQHVM